MPRGRRRKIEVPTGNTQPQFELGDTAEDIERRRRERDKRDERDRIELEERDREKREESQERGEKRVRTDTDTDVESTQSRQKKGKMKSIFLTDSDEEAIVEFVKQHEELYGKTRQAEERKTLGAASSYQKHACQDCEEVVLRLNVPDIASSLRRSLDKQLRRAQNVRPG